MTRKIKELLDLIIKTTYPNEKILPFVVKFKNKALKTRNGRWQKNRNEPFATITVVNLERSTKEILKTNIHEIAHHVEYSIHRATGHSKRFYLIYKNLLETAIKLGLLTFDEIQDLYDIQQLIAAHGKIRVECGSLKELIDGKSIIKVNKSYPIKDILRERGYTYSALEQNWMKEVDTSLVDEEVAYLSTIIDAANINVSQLQDLEIKAKAYILVDNCYEYRDILKKDGYIFNGYGHTKEKAWVKKICINDKQAELDKLSNLNGITVEVKLLNPKPPRKRKHN